MGHERKIVIPSIRYVVFEALMEFLYTNQFDSVDGKLAIQLYDCADLYRVEALKELCELKVRSEINDENAPFLLKVADEMNNLTLRDVCIRYIVTNFDTVSKTEHFKVLSMHLVHEVLLSR